MPIYFDNAATTSLAPEVIEAMTEVMLQHYGNPSSTHQLGRKAKSLVETSRKSIAKYMGCAPSELIFTSGGSESDNVAIVHTVLSLGIKNVVSSPLEHHAVLKPIKYLEENHGVKVIWLDHDHQTGKFALSALSETLSALEGKTLVSVMHVNNEIGTINPIEDIAKICEEHHALFHSDTTQAIGVFDYTSLGVKPHFMVGSAHKFHGPKGVGFLVRRLDVDIPCWQLGGGQEKGFRAGTENVAAIVGMAKAIELMMLRLEEKQNNLKALKNYLVQKIGSDFPGVDFVVNSNSESNVVPKITSLLLPPRKDHAMFMFQLDMASVAISGGSACQSGALGGSHVLNYFGFDKERPALRVSFNANNTIKEVDDFLTILKSNLY